MKSIACLSALAFGFGAFAHADVRETQENSFVIESSASTTASPAVSGAITMDTKKLAPGVDQVMSEQLARLKAFADKSADKS